MEATLELANRLVPGANRRHARLGCRAGAGEVGHSDPWLSISRKRASNSGSDAANGDAAPCATEAIAETNINAITRHISKLRLAQHPPRRH
jgi:hypothetical protein